MCEAITREYVYLEVDRLSELPELRRVDKLEAEIRGRFTDYPESEWAQTRLRQLKKKWDNEHRCA